MLPSFTLRGGGGISGSGTTFGWLQDVLFMHVQGMVIMYYYKLSIYNMGKIAAMVCLKLELIGGVDHFGSIFIPVEDHVDCLYFDSVDLSKVMDVTTAECL